MLSLIILFLSFSPPQSLNLPGATFIFEAKSNIIGIMESSSVKSSVIVLISAYIYFYILPHLSSSQRHSLVDKNPLPVFFSQPTFANQNSSDTKGISPIPRGGDEGSNIYGYVAAVAGDRGDSLALEGWDWAGFERTTGHTESTVTFLTQYALQAYPYPITPSPGSKTVTLGGSIATTGSLTITPPNPLLPPTTLPTKKPETWRDGSSNSSGLTTDGTVSLYLGLLSLLASAIGVWIAWTAFQWMRRHAREGQVGGLVNVQINVQYISV